MPESEKQLPDEESRTHRKNEMLALQKLGKTLTEMTESQLDKIPISDEMKTIIRTYRTLKTNESKRRHMQYIGKKMRQVDADAVKKSIEIVQRDNAVVVEKFHDVEAWREQLILEGDDGLQKLMTLYPDIDRQQARQLIRKAQHDRKQEKKTGGELELFRFLRELLQG